MTKRASAAYRALERLGRHRESPVVRVAARGARALLRGFEGKRVPVADMEHNGELRVLQRLGTELQVVFDVGANVGNWTGHALQAGARNVHAFEISPSTSVKLAERYADDSRVKVNAFGLGSAPGTVTVRHFADHPTLTTITEYPHDATSTPIAVPVQRGDDYVVEHGIDRIDFMKLDVEGAEATVLSGFRETFERGAVRVVQFEYGKVSILTKYMLRDFYEELTSHGFTVGKIAPNEVKFAPYDFGMERFDDSNWLAVHRSCPELIELVS